MKRGLVSALWRSVRPHQWLSNLVVFGALVFSRNLLVVSLALKTIVGFAVLCCLSSTIFLLNDLVDRDRDRRHPIRQHRPLAAGEITGRQAIVAAVVLAAVALVGAFVWQLGFALAAAAFFLVMVAYSLALRHLPVLDVLTIAAGLVLRAVAGALLIQVVVSPWLYLGVGGLGLILALGRIQHEMRLAAAAGTLEQDKYSLDAVAQMNSVTMTSTLMVYCLYTFLAPGFETNHLMMLTIPPVIYGLFRYRYLTIQHAGDQSPERLMLSDVPLLIAVALWIVTAAAVLYVRS